ncbi:response regulator transcription factor [Pseudodesulfovibrio sp. zrk46]|uniref:LytR/AlgR family response regulator transcription factor n=1 Tax=Pseudodesulfovibrio sp. zrk46 TaxID=2725288 RepID=UPI0014499EED|nr:response regulator transcription factor [Pseudodesulfovibrio sp. zrk46]QJB57538.1 response regulator transcription factor [Pseudodesulfovibrio sp. zrk46]
MSKTIRTILVDDELPAQDELSYLLSSHSDVEIINTVDNATDAVDLIVEHRPDLVFLDIQMPGQNGFHVLKELMALKSRPLVIFVTAFDEYAIRAFEENAVDYILKPVDKKRLASSLDRVRKLLKPDEVEDSGEVLRKLLADVGIKPGVTRISVESSGRNILLNPREIVYFDYVDRRVQAGTRDDVFRCAAELTLDKLEERLTAFSFFRVNRSQLVNLAMVRSYAPWFNGKYVLTMNDGKETEITVSKARVKDFKTLMEL